LFPIPEDKLLKGWLLTAVMRSRPNHKTWWRSWHEMTSSNASDHGNPAGITVSMPKGTSAKGIYRGDRNFGKWLS
jgi:hypothetical protein